MKARRRRVSLVSDFESTSKRNQGFTILSARVSYPTMMQNLQAAAALLSVALNTLDANLAAAAAPLIAHLQRAVFTYHIPRDVSTEQQILLSYAKQSFLIRRVVYISIFIRSFAPLLFFISGQHNICAKIRELTKKKS